MQPSSLVRKIHSSFLPLDISINLNIFYFLVSNSSNPPKITKATITSTNSQVYARPWFSGKPLYTSTSRINGAVAQTAYTARAISQLYESGGGGDDKSDRARVYLSYRLFANAYYGTAAPPPLPFTSRADLYMDCNAIRVVNGLRLSPTRVNFFFSRASVISRLGLDFGSRARG